MTRHLSGLTFAFLALCAANSPQSSFAQGTAITYQGRLSDGPGMANGIYDLRFTIYDALTDGNAMAGPITNSASSVTGGLFTVTLDFGVGVFTGDSRWLEIGVRTNGTGSFETIVPRQALTAAPYAITAGEVTDANIARLNVPNTAVQATGHPIVTSGFVTGAVVDSAGSGYVTAPAVAVVGTGSGAHVTSTLSNGVVASLTVQNAGSGYSNATTLTIGAPPPNNYQVFVTSNYFPNVNVFSNAANVFIGDGAGLSGVWKLAGNAGTTGTQFLGTTDNQPLEIKVRSRRAWRAEYATNGTYGETVNLIAGASNNAVAAGVVGATISGGGTLGFANRINSDLGTIGGGYNNSIQTGAAESTICGGVNNNITNSVDSAVGGGNGNRIAGAGAGLAAAFSAIAGGGNNMIGVTNSGSGTIIFEGAHFIGGGEANRIWPGLLYSAIGGGVANTILSSSATIAGGDSNFVQSNGDHSFIGGGSSNTNNASFASIPGGSQNVAAGDYSFAAGRRAKANHNGVFVWADSQNADFASTGTNQFLVRASSGVGINKNSPATALDVNGTVTATSFAGDGSTLTGVAPASGSGNYVQNQAAINQAAGFRINGNGIFNGGRVGIGTTSPSRELEVQNSSDVEIGVKSTDTGGHLWTLQSSSVTGSPSLDASFQIIDRTLNASRFYIGTNGFVGIGTRSSDVPLTIRGSGSNPDWLTFTSAADVPQWQINGFGGGLNIAQSAVTDGRLFLANNGNAGIGTLNPTNKLQVAGGVSATAFVSTSDRNAKENFAPISPTEVLKKVAALPITTWDFKEMPGARHMGPMAQDFYAAFGLGGSDTTITTVDPDGVALAAIQGLNLKLEAKEAEVQELKDQVAELRALVRELINQGNGSHR